MATRTVAATPAGAPGGAEEAHAAVTSTVVLVHSAITACRSEITGRTLYLNAHATAFAVSPHFSAEALAAAAAEWEAHCARLVARETANVTARGAPAYDSRIWENTRLTRALRAAAAACWQAPSAESFERALDALLRVVAEGAASGRLGMLVRPVELLTLMWKHQLVLFPAGWLWRPRFGDREIARLRLPDVTPEWYGASAGLIGQVKDGCNKGPDRVAVTLFTTMTHVAEPGDIGLAVVEALRPEAVAASVPSRHAVTDEERETKRTLPHWCHEPFDSLLVAQRAAYDGNEELRSRVPAGYRAALWPERWKRERHGALTFAWMEAHGARVARWRQFATDYVAARRDVASLEVLAKNLNPFLDYVIAEATIPADPMAFLVSGFAPATDFLTWLTQERGVHPKHARPLAVTRQFLGWCIKQKRAGLPKSTFTNPLREERVAEKQRSGQTMRRPIPPAYLEMMREIIEDRPRDEQGNIRVDPVTGQPMAPTYAWAKSLRGDQFEWRDPVTGTLQKVWSPVRAYLFPLRLTLPLRGFQARMLDSGELDPRVFRPDAPGADLLGWLPNAAPAARRPEDRGAYQGFARRITSEPSIGDFVGLFVNTNKTADRMTAWDSPGYTLPWVPSELLELLCELRDWQETYNPLPAPLRRDQLAELTVRTSKAVADRLPPLCPLFRDAASVQHRDQPVTYSRTLTFWRALVEELERRLERMGVTRDDGQRITLVHTRDEKTDGPRKVEWDMHSLRVAGITNFVVQGVPLHILSSFVAGHATTLMTYYYVRLSPKEIAESLTNANARIRAEQQEQRRFRAFVLQAPLRALQKVASVHDVEALRRLRRNGETGTVWVEIGLCPVAGALCHEGGPARVNNRSLTVHDPVVGGPRNCACCRFLLTGGPWKGALAAKYNETMGRYAEATELLSTREAARRALYDRYANTAFDPARLADPEYTQAEIAVTAARDGLVEIVETLGRLEWHITRIRTIEDTPATGDSEDADGAGDAGRALVLGGTMQDFEYALQQTSQYELVDRIAQSAKLYPWVDARLATRKRAQFHDRLLAFNGVHPLFGTLADDEMHRTTSAFAWLLRMTVPPQNHEAVVTGRMTLAEAGVTLDLEAALARHGLTPMRMASLPRLQRPRTRALPSGPAAEGPTAGPTTGAPGV